MVPAYRIIASARVRVMSPTVLVIGMTHLYSFQPPLQLCYSSTQTTDFINLIHFQRTYAVLIQTHVGNSGQCSLSPITYCFNFKNVYFINRNNELFDIKPITKILLAVCILFQLFFRWLRCTRSPLSILIY